MSLIGYGLFFFSINKNLKISSSYGYAGLTGILILSIYSYLSSFIIEHNQVHNLIILIIGLISFFYFNFKWNNQNKYLLFFLAIYFIGYLIFKTHDDFPYYHFKYSYYLTQFSSVVGIGNFDLGYRTPSSIFYLNSLFYLPFVKYFMFQMTAFSIFLFSSIILIDKIRKNTFNKNYDFFTYFYLLSFIFINIFFYRISEHGTDRSAQILILILIGEILFFVNFKSDIKRILSKLFILISIIISLKAFYILYMIFFIIISYHLYKSYNPIKVLLYFLTNHYFNLLLILFVLVLSVNFINSGCLIYPVTFTCFDNFSWAISKSEVQDLNDWYEQWSKAGAGPNFRVENPEIYIKNFNWLSNWVKEYFFTKGSDFILGLTLLSGILLFIFKNYNNKLKKINKKKINFTLLIIFILFAEWFYNHPTLRYGGYCLIAAFVFILTANKIEKSNLNFEAQKKRIIILVIFSLAVFFGRNVDRIVKENKQYNYNPIKNVYYNIEDSYFDLDKMMKKMIINYESCIHKKSKCNIHKVYDVKKIHNFFIFFPKT